MKQLLAGKKLPVLYRWDNCPMKLKKLLPAGLDYDLSYLIIAVSKGPGIVERLSGRLEHSPPVLLHKVDVEGYQVEYIQPAASLRPGESS